jgi:predicted HicB family RNase H-like nuclease
VSNASHTVRHASRQVHHAAEQQVHRARNVASRVATRVNAHPVARAATRTASFAKRTIGHAESGIKFGEGLKGLAEKAHTTVKDVRQAVKTRSLRDVGTAFKSVTDTVKSAGEVAAQATQAREGLRNIKNDFRKTFPKTATRLANQYKKAAGVAANVADRIGLDRVATAAKKLTTRVANNPAAQAFRRTAGFTQRTLGSAHTLVEFGGKVKDLAGKTHTAASDIRQAIKNRSLKDAGTALKSSWEAVKSAKDVVTSSSEAREALRSIKNDFAKTFPKTAGRLGAQYKKAAGAAANVANRLGGERVKNAASKLISRATQSPAGQALQRLQKNAKELGAAGAPLVQLGQGVHGVFTKAPGALRDIRQALKTRSTEDIEKAFSSSKEVLSSAKDIAEAAPQARQSLRVLGKVAQRMAPKVSARVAGAASKVAASAGGKVAAKVAQKVAGNAVAKAGTKALGKAAGRFAPGVNVAIAVADSASFVKTLRDPKASVGAKITSGVTALGSIAAATNIPVVSQVGAGVSLVSSVVGGWFK